MSNYQIRMALLTGAIILLIIGNYQEPYGAEQQFSIPTLMKLAGSLILVCLFFLWLIGKLENLKVR